MFLVVLASFVFFVSAGDARERQPADCTTAAACRQLTLDAIERQEFEHAHDLAWRFFQTSPRGSSEAMTLLARAQSLAGRGDDAFVMLQRLADAGVVVDEVETSDDFRRVREHPRWPQLVETMASLRAAAPAAAPVATEAPVVPKAPAAPEPPAAAEAPEAIEAIELISLPGDLPAPGAFAYDAVSARFILADAASDVLRVLSEQSGNATTFVSAGWSGHDSVSAVGLNRRNGDMWVAVQSDTTSALNRFQLVSGRLLRTIESPEDAGPTRFAALAVATDAIYVLDATGRRIFATTAKGDALRGFAALPKNIEPIGLAHTGASLVVSHKSGLLRVDLSSRMSQPIVSSGDFAASDLHALAWHQGSLWAIRRSDKGASVVRVRLNGGATNVTRVDVIASTSATTGALAGDAYYFLGLGGAGAGLSFRSVPVLKR